MKFNPNLDKKEQIKTAWHRLIDSEDNKFGTYYFDLGQFNGYRWAIVMAWMDYDNQDDWCIYAKVAYQPINSIMQCDYDIDWLMPINYNDEVWDTEVVMDEESELDRNIDWLFEEWEEIEEMINLRLITEV